MRLKILLTLSVVLSFGSLFGQSEQTVTFKFKSGEDGFFADYRANRTRLDELYSYIDLYKSEITSGKLPIHVTGYCKAASEADREAALKIGAVRSNRVKTEMIQKKGLNESCFVSSSRSIAYEGLNDVVIVTLTVPTTKPVEQKPVIEEKKPEPQKPVEEKKPVIEEKKPVEKQPEPIAEPKPEPVYASKKGASNYCFAFSTNLLYDLALAPNLGIEWKPAEHWGILVNGAVSHWDFDGGDKRHRLWMVSPEIRYYTGEKKQLYLGGMFHTGEFNMKFNDTGYQGKFMGGGIVAGYLLRLSDVFNLDMGIGLGCTRADYDSYNRINGYDVKKSLGNTKDIWGPTKAAVTLQWKIK